MTKRYGGTFSRRGPDVLSEELAVVLCGTARFGFKPLFALVHANLRARKLANGGEDMLRLRLYEKLQELVHKGAVQTTMTKEGKEYSALVSLASLLTPPMPIAPMPIAPMAAPSLPLAAGGAAS